MLEGGLGFVVEREGVLGMEVKSEDCGVIESRRLFWGSGRK